MKTVIAIFFTACAVSARAQCVAVDFTVQATACSRENIDIQNTTSGGDTFEWDFCSGDFALAPDVQVAASGSSFFRARVFRTVYANDTWYGFAIDQPSGTLIRFRFGSSLDNTPVVTSLGNPQSSFNGPLDLRFWNEGANWFALVANTDGNSILRLSFGSNLETVPTVTNLGSLSGAIKNPAGVVLAKEGNSLFAFVTNATAAEVVRLDFGNSLTNAPSATVIAVPGATPRAIAITRECARWYAIITSYSTNQLFYLDFAAGINQAPVTGVLSIPSAGYSFPASISIANEGAVFYAFIQSAFPGNVYKINFGSSIIDGTGVFSDLGNLGISSDNSAFELASDHSRWYGFSIDLSGNMTPGSGRLMRLNFPDNCSASLVTYTGKNPPLYTYSAAGSYGITQKAISGEIVTYQSKTIAVSAAVAPDISFMSQNVCANHDVMFIPQNISGNITNYSWAFGDAGSAAIQSPAHSYASAGTFQVNLQVTAANACQNFIRNSITIYDQPVADFTVPSASPLCTNQNFLFNNVTPDVGLMPSWEWSVNSTLVSSGKDLAYTFTSTANQEVKLKVSIPGCESEKVVNINTLVAGPKPDFTITGQCEDANVMFTNASTGIVTGYSWNFGDGQTSTLPNPVNVYANPGPFTVVLTASNAAGCNNTFSKPLTVFSKPQVDFITLAPPFSCSGTPAQFNDLTPPPSDSNLSSWLWNFGDAGSASNISMSRNPQHTYVSASDYTVSLTVTTNFSCSATLQKPVTIYQTPVASFTHLALCEDAPVTFSDAGATNQAWNWQVESDFYFTKNIEHTFTAPGNYDVSLSVTAANNCIGTTVQTVTIPPKLVLDFSSWRSCINQDTEFTNLTEDSSDPVTNIHWNFGGLGSASGSPAVFTFLETGTVNVTLTANTESGCTYPFTKPIAITPGPLAAFTANPNTGEAPLRVDFINTSLNANVYAWKFNDMTGSESTGFSPSFVYTEEGNYTAELVAWDLHGCVDTTHQLIEVLAPSEVNPPSPNPGNGIFTVEWRTDEATPTSMVLVDATGREIRTFNILAHAGVNRVSINIKGEQPGLYILRIRYLDRVTTYRLIISE